MLACARLGAIHSVVFGGFAAHELAVRIDDARPRVILSASCGLEGARAVAYKPLLDAALAEASHAPEHCVILQRPQLAAELTAGRDLDWGELVAAAEPAACVPVLATDPLYILYTSGTTGRPKGVVRDNGGHAVALAWSMANVYDVHPGEVFWAASDVGWVVGHSYIVYAPLLAGTTTVLYEGKPVGTPDAGAFWRVIEQHDVAALFTAPTAIRAIRKEDPEAELLAGRDAAVAAHALPGRRAHRPRHLRVGGPRARSPRGRPLVADRDGLGDRPRAAAASTRRRSRPARPACPCPAGASTSSDADGGLSRAASRAPSRIRLPLPPGRAPDALERRRALRRLVPRALPRLVPDGRRRAPRRGRLPVRDGAHRRRHQRRRPPPLDGRDGGGRRDAPRRRRVRRLRRPRRAARRGAARARRAEGRRRARCGRAARRARRARAGARRAGCLLPRRARRRAPAEDALGQDPALARCATSPRAATTRCRPRSTIRRSSTRSPSCSVEGVPEVQYPGRAWPCPTSARWT